MKLALGLLLALASAAALSGGFYVQHGAAGDLPPLSLRHPVRSLRALFGHLRWLAGFVLGIGGWGLYVGALAFAPLSLVQACSAGGIALLAVLTRTTVPRERAGVALAFAGLVLLGISLAGGSDVGHATSLAAPVAWLAVSAVAAAGFARAGSLAASAGILYAAGDVATKAALHGGSGIWLVPAVLAAHALGFVALQLSFQRGGALATVGVSTLLMNSLPILAGVAVFGEALPGGALGVARAAAFALVVAGASALGAPGAPVVEAVAVVALALVPSAHAALLPRIEPGTRGIEIHYVAHDGAVRSAWVLLPSDYTPASDRPLPLVISPHGRGVDARANARLWGDLPGRDDFAVVNPEGQGRRLALYSWGDPGQIDDLARMPAIVEAALPWVHVDRKRIYAVGGSMGGQETLLLVARDPHLLAGAISFDAPTNLALRYDQFSRTFGGGRLQRLARFEVGATPATDAHAFAVRSPLAYAPAIAASGVPLQLWWSTTDRVVVDQARQSGLLYRTLEALGPVAPVTAHVGIWAHCAEMRWTRRLPEALAEFHLAMTGYN